MKPKILIFDLDDTLFPRLPDGFTEEELRKIRPLPGVVNFLSKNKINKNINVLVTKGEKELQLQKINQLNLTSFFHLIKICSHNQEKKENFQKVMEKYPHHEYWVIGDRIDSEIRFGKELGLKTIHLQRGKYKDLKPKDNFEMPDYQITSFDKISGIIS
ncbi:HAD family hydrolase [Candidatus Woesearchaeota archaeon]|nr:HAD family hydrolase [Candidatus Woesearchaeota archaeon]